jgi:hypothetical protein
MKDLSIKQKRTLQKASRPNVEDYFISFPPKYRAKKWLLKTNRYRERCTSLFYGDTKSGTTSLSHSDMRAYVSASAPTQVIDGWSYLGRAIDATLRGDSYAAIHMGYYAELRAAMGLLASEGIGVLGSPHAIIDKKSSILVFKGDGTHKDIWPMLRHWAKLQRAADLLDDLVSPNSIQLSDWLTTTKAIVPVRAVAQYWLQSWGLDLANVDDDHNSRNLVSYRPSEFRKPNRLDVHQQTSFVEELWQLFEPGTTRRFPYLERLLLRNAYRKQNGVAPTSHNLEKLGLSPQESGEWIAFLQQKNDPSPLHLAENCTPVEDPTCHLSIISRASLLLFLASAAARRLMSNAGYSSDDIFFWWGRQGEERALWNNGLAPSNPQDLWADIAQSIGDSAAWRTNNPIGSVSLRDWRQSQSSALVDFGGFELAGIWALLP